MALYIATCFNSQGIIIRQFIHNIKTCQFFMFLQYTLVISYYFTLKH